MVHEADDYETLMFELAEAILAYRQENLHQEGESDEDYGDRTALVPGGIVLGYRIEKVARELGIERDACWIEEPSRDLHLRLRWKPCGEDGAYECRTRTHRWLLDQHWYRYEAHLYVERREDVA